VDIELMVIAGVMLVSCQMLSGAEQQQSNRKAVAETSGLIAFWDFNNAKDNTWVSYYDAKVVDRTYALHLRRIGDAKAYSIDGWPYQDDNSQLMYDRTGPFGNAVRFNKGYIYGAVERKDFDGTLLDLHGRRPFTMISWVKFTGSRHMVAGIWDEGGWNKYAGRRQAAIFAGLFGRKGPTAHISATGASSFPQSTAKGSQYARCRALDGAAFENNRWVALAMTYDPQREEVSAYLNGVMTPLAMTDPVEQDVYQYKDKKSANPYKFSHPIYSPGAFVLKYNGYSLATNGISEHRLPVDLENRCLIYGQDKPEDGGVHSFRIFFDIKRQGESILSQPVEMKGVDGQRAEIPSGTKVAMGDEVWTRLEMQADGEWQQIGTVVKREIQEGAPFTFGRALGLGAEELNHGSQLYLDGVAVFNRVLSAEEIKGLSFTMDKEAMQ